ncbi:MAG: chemotaxis protein CheW [Anaerolineaceae bacterium]
MKSTLDSLFSSTKSQAQEMEAQDASATPEKAEEKPSRKAPTRPAVERKQAAVKTSAPAPKTKPTVKKTAEKPKNPVMAVTPKKTPESTPSMPPPAEKGTPLAPPVVTVQTVSPPIEKEAPRGEETPKNATSSPAVMEEPRTGTTGKTEHQETKAEVTAEVTIPKNGEVGESDEEEHLVVFLLGNESFGISIQMVESIIKKQAITKVPHAEKFILGVTNLRGTVVPVVDLRQRFAMPRQEATKDTRIIVLNTDSGKNGIVVDEVVEVMRLPKKAIAPTPMIATTINSSFITGIARTENKLIILLDANTILQQ